MQQFTLLIKPSGSECNLNCPYCFYKDRSPHLGTGRQRMSDEVLEKLIADYLSLGFAESVFSWQGGEPTLMGLDFFKNVVELQKKDATGSQKIGNSLQTNAILLDDEWCRFLHDYRFLVGISIDGPKELHDFYRVDHAGGGSFEKVIQAIELCRRHDVEFNTLTLLNNHNVEHAEKLFDFLAGIGVEYVQFIPCVEWDAKTGEVKDFSITPQQYGDFLCRLFDHWLRCDRSGMRVREFDSILQFLLTGVQPICTFDRQCNQYIVVEHNGDCFPCDFFVEPGRCLGNVTRVPLERQMKGPLKRHFARCKEMLPDKCLICTYLDLCRGGCSKHRFNPADPEHDRESYFCQSYRKFFDHTHGRFMHIAAELKAKHPQRRRQGETVS